MKLIVAARFPSALKKRFIMSAPSSSWLDTGTGDNGSAPAGAALSKFQISSVDKLEGGLPRFLTDLFRV
jgi:hypothetical protein